MNPFITRGAISWPELQTNDVPSAVSFYKKVFGWSIDTMPMPTGDYNVVKIGDAGIAGIFQAPDASMPTAWMFYVTVNDVAKIAAHAVKLGGNIIMPAMEVPTVGTLLGIQDPTGAVIMAIKYDESQEEQDAQADIDFAKAFTTHGMFSWFELRTPDIEKAGKFYTDLFGWEIKEMPMPEGAYHSLSLGDVGFGGIAQPPQAEVPPHWGAYVTVDDVDKITKLVKEAGGTIAVPGMDIEGVGRFNMFQDPTGAWLSAITYAPVLAEDT